VLSVKLDRDREKDMKKKNHGSSSLRFAIPCMPSSQQKSFG
jgi:hypothetical protein